MKIPKEDNLKRAMKNLFNVPTTEEENGQLHAEFVKNVAKAHTPDIPEMIKQFRNDQGSLTYRQAAALLNTDHTSLYQWEHRKRRPPRWIVSYIRLFKFAQAYGMEKDLTSLTFVKCRNDNKRKG